MCDLAIVYLYWTALLFFDFWSFIPHQDTTGLRGFVHFSIYCTCCWLVAAHVRIYTTPRYMGMDMEMRVKVMMLNYL